MEPHHDQKKSSAYNRSPWLWLFFAALLLLLIICSVWFYNIQAERLQHEVEENLTAIAQLKVDQITAWRREQINVSQSLVGSQLFQQVAVPILAGRTQSTDVDVESLFALVQMQNSYARIALLDTEGEVLAATGREAELAAHYRPLLNTAVAENRTVFVDLHRDQETATDLPHIAVITPVFVGPAGGQPLGALLTVTEADELLYPLIRSWPVASNSAETLLIRREGDAVLFLNDLRHQDDTALNLRLPLSQTDLPAVMAVEGQEGFIRGYDYRGVEVAAVLLPVPDSSWYMVSKVDADEAFAGWQFQSGLILAGMGALLAATFAAGLMLWQQNQKAQYRSLYEAEAALRASASRHDITLNAIGDGVIVTDNQGRVELLNPVAETLTGWSADEAAGRPLVDVFQILNEETLAAVENPVDRVLREGKIQSLANHTLLISRDGQERPIADSAAPIFNEDGDIAGVVLVFRDQTEERSAQQLTQIRLDLNTYAADHTLSELLTYTLDEAGALIRSPIGFFHFVDADQKTVQLQQWSTATLQEYCQAEGHGRHYPIDEAGVWTDCVASKKPLIHNDYHALEHKRGLPPGHAELVRELVVPVLRDDKVVAILGVGNKSTAYTDHDVELINFVADVVWVLVEKKRAEEKLHESREILATAEKVAGLGSWKWDLRSQKVTWSAGMHRLFAIPLDNFDGDLSEIIAARIHPEDVAAVEASNESVLREREPAPLSYRIILPDGTERTLWAQGELTVDASGQPAALTGYVQDITERRRAADEREALLTQNRRQAQKLQKIMETVPEGILLLSGDHQVLQANAAARRLLPLMAGGAQQGDPVTRLGNRPLAALLRPPSHGLWHEMAAENRHFEVSATPFTSTPSEDGWVLAVRETTARREIEEQLQQQERLAAVGKLAAGIAHDFNNLLAVIVLNAQLLQMKLSLAPREDQQLNVILQQADRATRLIQQILDFSRRSTLEMKPLEMRVLLKEEIELLKRALPEHIEIELNVADGDYMVRADLTRIQQVVMNLAINARDAMPNGGRLRLHLSRLHLDADQKAPLAGMPAGDWVHLTIADSGNGIAPEIRDRIFDPFFTTKEPGKGTGLGLAQVHGLVAQHAGHIDVASTVGLGTTFDIYLPMLQSANNHVRKQQAEAVVQGQGQTLLIVEDEEVLRLALAEALVEWGYDVVGAANGEEAIVCLTQMGDEIDVIVSDVVMPRMGGIAFVQTLRRYGWQHPVVMMSGHPLDLDTRALEKAGVVRVLPKPLSPAELTQTIADLLAADEER